MTKSLELLNNRRSAKRFKNDFKITKEQEKELLESARMAPSSFGMEPFRVLYIKNKQLREELLAPWWNQPGITAANAIMIWVVPTEKQLNEVVVPEQNKRNVPEEFASIRNDMAGGLQNVLKTHQLPVEHWAAKQAYISMGTSLVTAAELGIDVCPSEGFDPEAVMSVLEKHKLADKSREKVVVGMFVGKVDTTQDFHYFFNKTRKPADEAYKIVE